MPSQQVLQKKAEEVEEAISLMQQCETIGVASLYKVRAVQLQKLKKKLAKDLHLRVFKNVLMERAIDGCKDKPGLEKLKDYVKGPSIFLFTDLSSFKLARLLEKSRVKAMARAGDKAGFDIVVPEGNTGLPPGPILSQLGVVGLPTRIKAGSIWVNRDTLVAKEGETIPLRLAEVLSKLGIKPVEVGLTLKASYEDGLVMTEEQLHVDLEEFQQGFVDAHLCAFNLSVNAAYPTSENIVMLLKMGGLEAFKLSLNAEIPTPETIEEFIRKAYAEALSLSRYVKD
jgi:large subunit ribosomal protein L10